MILGLFGNVGKFKTTLATLICLVYLMNGYPVYTNYEVKFERFQHLIHKLSLSELLELEVDFGLILIDEVYTIAESRISTSKVNRFFSYFIFQSRKLRVDIIYTAQLSSAVDLRLFKLTDKKIACYGLNSSKTRVKFELIQEKNGKEKRRKFSMPLEFFVEWIFNHFDTYQAIDPLGIQDLIVDIERFDGEKINKRVDDAVEKVRPLVPKNCYKYQVSDVMLRLGLPQSLVTFVYNRIKSNQGTKRRYIKSRVDPNDGEEKRRLVEKTHWWL